MYTNLKEERDHEIHKIKQGKIGQFVVGVLHVTKPSNRCGRAYINKCV